MSRNKSSINTLSKLCGLNYLDIAADEYTLLYIKYLTVALNRYKWTNLPKGLESRHIEKGLLEHGQVFFYEKKNIGLVCLPCSPINQPNFYNDPTHVQVTGVGVNEQKNINSGVRILNDEMAVPSTFYIRNYIDKIVNVEKTILKNLNQQRNPHIFRTTKDKEFSTKAALRKIENDETAIIVDEALLGGDNSFVADDIWKDFRSLEYNTLKREYEKELLEHLGINTIINKQSGMATDELNSNNEKIEMMLDLGYKTRKLAEAKINEIYGLNVKVEKVAATLNPTFETTVQKKEGGQDS